MVGNDCMKECGRFQQDLDFILKSCKANFILIQEHHLNAVRINNVSLLLNKEWLCHCSEAFGESGIQVGVAILKRRLCPMQTIDGGKLIKRQTIYMITCWKQI